jgi:heat shock protein HslJ
MKTLFYLVSLIVLVSLMAGCGNPATPTEAPATATAPIAASPAVPEEALAPTEAAAAAQEDPVAEATGSAYDSSLFDIPWQWAELIQADPADSLVVPAPENYWLIFGPDGEFQVRADCNTGSGLYRMEGSNLSLELGPMTTAVCGPDSLYDPYLGMLASVEAVELDNGWLILHLADDGGSMVFFDGGLADAVAGESGAADWQTLDPERIGLDATGLPYAWQANLVPEVLYDDSLPPGPVGLPEHIQINFGADADGSITPENKQPGDPVIYIIPLDTYIEIWEANDDPSVTIMLDEMWTLLDEEPEPMPSYGLPVLPFEELEGVNDLAVQGSYPDFGTWNGLRFVGRFAQGPDVVTNEGMRYVFQGISEDGLYLIAFFYPVSTQALPEGGMAPVGEQARAESDPAAYLDERVEALDKLAPADWVPDLTILDSVMASLDLGSE